MQRNLQRHRAFLPAIARICCYWYLCRYVQLNVQYSDAYRQYSPDLPAFLRNRPRDFVLHVCNRWTNAASYTKNKVTKVDSVRFIVDSEERDTKYDVFFGDDSEMPYCQCYDWSKYHWPCKHMLAVIQHTDTTWQTLCPTYRDSPFFTLDTDLLSVPATYDNAVIHSTATCDSETTVNSIPDAEDGNVASPVRSMSARCREVLRVLTDATYICSDPVGLQNLHTHLQNAAKELQTFLPQDSGLVLCDPPKRSRKNKKVRVRSQQKDDAHVKPATENGAAKRSSSTEGPVLRKRTRRRHAATTKRVRFDDSMPNNEGKTLRGKGS